MEEVISTIPVLEFLPLHPFQRWGLLKWNLLLPVLNNLEKCCAFIPTAPVSNHNAADLIGPWWEETGSISALLSV